MCQLFFFLHEVRCHEKEAMLLYVALGWMMLIPEYSEVP